MTKEKKKKVTKKQKMLAIIIVFAIVIAITIIVVLLFKNNNGNGENTEPINENFAFLVKEESSEIPNVDVFETQDELTKEILDTYKKGKYTVDKPYVVVNPYLISPQSALILFKTDKKEKVTVTLKGKHNDDLVTTFAASKDHYLPIYGLYGEYTNKIILETESGKTHTVEIKLDKTLNSAVVEVLENKVTNSNGEFYFGTTAIGVASIAYDNYGEVRWFLSADYSKGMTMLQNGHLLMSDITPGPDAVSTGGAVEVDMLGYIHHEYEITGGYHHDAYEMPNGNLIILTSDNESDTTADVVVELNRKTGEIVKTWDLHKIADAVDPNMIEYGEITWGWINSVTYDDTNNELILSVRNRNSVVSLDYTTGNIKWILGERKYWSSKFEPYLIKGIGNDFIYPAGQHSVVITDEGYLSIFNNGYNAYKEKTVSCASLRNNASYAMIYNIDKINRTASVVYKYGGQEYFSYALSSYTYSTNGHKIFNSGWHFSTDSVYSDSTCTQYSNDLYDSYVIDFDKDNNEVVKMRINESKFEVIKAPIYNLAAVSVKPTDASVIANYNFDSNASYLTSNPDDTYETLTEEEALSYKEYTANPLAFTMHNNRLSFEGVIPEEMTLKVTLISPKGTAYRFNLKDAYGTMKDFVNISSLPGGRYYVYVNLNNFIYNTKQYVEL